MDGISQDNGLTTYYSQEVELARMMLSRAATKIIAADATKLGRTAFAKIADISAADYIITTEHPSTAEDAELLKSNVQNFIMV